MTVYQLAYHERLEEFEGDFLRQSTFMQVQIQANTNDAATRVIDAFAEQIMAEAALFSL